MTLADLSKSKEYWERDLAKKERKVFCDVEDCEMH